MPKLVDHQKYRNELLAQSFEFLADKGYANVTMRELAKHLAISTGTLYHYFPNKDAIFEELVEFQAEQDILLASSIDDSGTLVQRVEKLLKLMANHQDYMLKQAIFWLEFAREKGFDNLPLSDATKRSCQRYQDFLQHYLQIEDPALVSFAAIYLSGLTLEMPMGNIEISIKKQSAILANLLAIHEPSKSINSTKSKSKK